MSFRHATLELAEELFKTCNFGGTCKELATCVLIAGVQEQVVVVLSTVRLALKQTGRTRGKRGSDGWKM